MKDAYNYAKRYINSLVKHANYSYEDVRNIIDKGLHLRMEDSIKKRELVDTISSHINEKYPQLDHEKMIKLLLKERIDNTQNYYDLFADEIMYIFHKLELGTKGEVKK